MKNKFIDFWTRNPLLKLISLGVAFFLWLVVVNYDDPMMSKTYSSIPIDLTNVSAITDAGKVYEMEDAGETVSVTVKAKRSIQNSLGRDDFRASADLSRVDENGNVPIEVKAIRYSDRIDSINIKGKTTVSVIIEPLKERQLNIQVSTKGDLPEEYKVGQVTLDKNVVKISGPQSKVDQVASAGVSVDVSGMTQDISTSEDVRLLDADGSVLDFDDVQLSRISVGVNVQLWKIKTLPITYGYTGEPAEGYATTGVITCVPDSIRIAGVASAVDKINSLVVPSTAVDITGSVTDRSVTVEATDYLPSGLTLADEDDTGNILITVGISILNKRTVEVPVANVRVANLPEGLSATVGGLGDMMAVEVQGLGERFENLEPHAIMGSIDVEQLGIAKEDGTIEPGAYDAPITFEFPEGITGGDNNVVAQLIIHRNDGEQTGDNGAE